MIRTTIQYFVGLMLLLSATAPFSVAQPSSGGMGSTLDKVQIETIAKLDTLTAGSEARFAVVMDIAEGWHLNAHNPTLDYLIGVKLSMDASKHAMVSDIRYPTPKQMQFSFAQDVLDVYEGKPAILVKVQTSADLNTGSYRSTGTLTVQACSDKVCLPPADVEVRFPMQIGNQTAVNSNHADLFTELENRETATVTSAEGNQIASMFNNRGNVWALLSIFLIGLALNLTPCVYPMMSVTVSLFGGSKTKQTVSTAATFSKALVYVLGIVFMYSGLGVVAAYTGELFGSWLQSPWVLAAMITGGVYLGFVEQSGNEKGGFRWLKYAIGVGTLAAGFMLFQNLQKEGVQWQEYDADVIEQTGKPVMLDFYADWCIPCIELDRKTFTDGRVIDQTESFVRMKVDLTHFDSKRAEKLRQKYGIAGVPTIMFLNSKGKEIKKARVVGFLSADNFLKRVEEVNQSELAEHE